MKIRVLSDLHLEFTRYQPAELPSCGEDLVALAGDIGEGVKGIQWARKAIPDRPVIYVCGNHEFYKQDWDRLLVEARAEAVGSNIHFLENDSVELGGLIVLGCTLWTDFRSMGAMVRTQAMGVAAHEMADYRLIRRDGRRIRLSPVDSALRCQDSKAWLDRQISLADRPVLVVTHHAPSVRTTNPTFALDLSNASFHNDFDTLIRPPVVAWIHGHSHFSCEAVINGIRVLSNQKGYPHEALDFNWDYLIEIEIPASTEAAL